MTGSCSRISLFLLAPLVAVVAFAIVGSAMIIFHLVFIIGIVAGLVIYAFIGITRLYRYFKERPIELLICLAGYMIGIFLEPPAIFSRRSK